jgi:hypothetical protein
MRINRQLVRDRLGRMGWRRGSEYRRTRVTPVERRTSVEDEHKKQQTDGGFGDEPTAISVQELQTA